MRYKTSCFNPTIARNSLRRFWPLPLAVLAAVVFFLMMPLMGTMQMWYSTELYRQEAVYRSVYSTGSVMVVLMAGAAFLTAALLFHHLHSRKEIQFYHALPLKRRCLFLTSYLTGFLMIAVPLALGILLCMGAAAGMGMAGAAVPLAKLLGAGIAVLVLFYSMAVVACCLAGQTFGAVLIYGGMNCAVLIIVSGAGSLAAMFMPGIDFDNFLVGVRTWLTPVLQLLYALDVRSDMIQQGVEEIAFPVGFSQPLALVAYGIAGVVLAALAGVLYQYRRGETAGEMVAFQPVRSVCKVFGALVVTAGGAYGVLSSGLFREEIPFIAVVVSVLAFGALGWIAAEMVVQKTFRVFRRRMALSCGILLAVLLVLMGAGKLDLFGTVRYVPEAGAVKEAVVCYNYGSEVAMSPEDAIAVHEVVLANRDALANNLYGQSYTMLSIEYTLQSGRHVARTYWIRDDFDRDYNRLEDPISQAVMEMLETPEYNYQTWFGDLEGGVTRDNFYHGTVWAYNWDEEGQYTERVTADHPAWQEDYMDLTAAEAVELYEAVCLDIQAGYLPPNGSWGLDSIGCMDFQCYDGNYSLSSGNVVWLVASVELLPEMEHTLDCLREMGFTFHLDN